METRIYTPISEVDKEFLRSVEATLRGAQGEAFDIWVRCGSRWLAWPSGEPIDSDPGLDPARLIPLLEAAANGNLPVSTPCPPRMQSLAIPFVQSYAPAVVAVAVATLTTDDLFQRFAGAVQQAFVLSQQSVQNDLVIDQCTRQISADLEQLTYLQSLGEHLQLCEVARSPLDVAQSVLPVLRELIHAESLVLLTAQEASAESPGSHSDAASPAIWIGRHVVDAAVCCDLVRHFRDATRKGPVTKNRLSERIDDMSLPGVNSFLLTEVAKDDLQVGWLLALNRTRDPDLDEILRDSPAWGLSDTEFGTVESGLMCAASSMLATHARNVHLFREKERLLIGVLRSLINAVDAKDSYTCGHSDRVALISRRLAEELGLPLAEQNALYLGGLLHDIGKIGVPDAVLLKAGKLCADEMEQIQQHPQRGYTILRHLDQLAYMLPGVLHHHESYDGRGYPDGLRGEAIPLAARIIAVADSYDAMSSSRPYRQTMPESRAEEILHSGAGTQWDPCVIEAFFRILPEIRSMCASAEVHTQRILAALAPGSGGEANTPDSLVAALTTTY